MDVLPAMKRQVITVMKPRTIYRHIRESMKSMRRNVWMTMASVSAVTVTLTLLGVFYVIMMNLNYVSILLEKEIEIRVHIDLVATSEEQDALRNQIASLPNVASITFSSKEEELQNLIDSMGDSGQTFKLFEQDNPLHDVFVVKTFEPADTLTVAESISNLEFVSSVRYGQGTVEKLFSSLELARNIGIIIIVSLLIAAMFLISNTIKITIFARKREIEIMRLVGATNSFIRWPFFLEGLWLGILGSILPVSLIYFGYTYTYEFFSLQLRGNFIQLIPVEPFVFQAIGLVVLVGCFIGVWGSVMSTRRFLKI